MSLNDVKFDVKYELSLLDNSFCLVIAKSMRYCHVESVQSNPSSDGLFRSACLKYYTRAAKDVGVSVSQEGCKSEASLPIAYFMPR